MQINEQLLIGNWKAGWAIDLHTISSRLLPDGNFETEYTELGKLLNLLKYHFDRKTIPEIAKVVASFLKTRKVFPYLEAIIPVPPSDINRPFQPVIELAFEIGKQVNIKVATDYLIKIKDTKILKILMI